MHCTLIAVTNRILSFFYFYISKQDFLREWFFHSYFLFCKSQLSMEALEAGFMPPQLKFTIK
jgi:hypothetical protein